MVVSKIQCVPDRGKIVFVRIKVGKIKMSNIYHKKDLNYRVRQNYSEKCNSKAKQNSIYKINK